MPYTYRCEEKPTILNCDDGKTFAIGTGDFRPGGTSCKIFILNGIIVGLNITSDRELNMDKGGVDYRKIGTATCSEKASFWTEI